ncbi:MAG: hypothetical protein KF691_08775 [Phycisphaeraceae bacterium]|nr:hypothetical protein [Phycisphaeraceae bacterium]
MRLAATFMTVSLFAISSNALGQITVSPNVFYDAPDFDVTDGQIDADPIAAGNQMTLRAILMHANFNGGNWKIILPSGNFNLTVPGAGENSAAAGDLDINGITVEIIGAPPLPGPPTVVGGSMTGDRVFHVLGGGRATFRNLFIESANSVGGGGLRQESGTVVTMEGVEVGFCSAVGAAGADGGGILSFGDLTLTDTNVIFNNCQGSGGGIEFQGTRLTMTGCNISSNTSGGRGGGLNIGTPGPFVTAFKTSFMDNRSGNAVGGGSGGGIANRSDLTLTDCVIENNMTSPGASGGGIENRGTVKLLNSTVRLNGAFLGAGMLVAGLSSAYVQDSLIESNFSDSGGGFYNAGTLEVRHSTISGNHAVGPVPGSGGGGIYSFATLYLVDSTISGNMAPAQTGGGLHNASNGFAEISSCTFHQNIANAGDSISSGDIGFLPVVVVRNSLLSNYPAAPASSNYTAPSGQTVLSQGYNLDTQGAFSLSQPSDIHPTAGGMFINPYLGALQNNGGPTPTHRLYFKSVAIGAADPNGVVDHTGLILPLDQRYFVRPNVNVADIGAYEAGCDADLYPPGGGDGVVDDFDFVEFAKYYNILVTAAADFDGDGDTDDDDFVAFAAAYNLLICE